MKHSVIGAHPLLRTDYLCPIPTTNKETNPTQKTFHGAPQRTDQRTRFTDWTEQSIRVVFQI